MLTPSPVGSAPLGCGTNLRAARTAARSPLERSVPCRRPRWRRSLRGPRRLLPVLLQSHVAPLVSSPPLGEPERLVAEGAERDLGFVRLAVEASGFHELGERTGHVAAVVGHVWVRVGQERRTALCVVVPSLELF